MAKKTLKLIDQNKVTLDKNINVEKQYVVDAKSLNENLPGSMAAEMKEVKKSVSDGKSGIASAITSKGITTAADASFDTMKNNINSIVTLQQGSQDANASAGDMLSGKTAYVKGSKVTGTIADRGQYQNGSGWGSGGSGSSAYYAINGMPVGYYHKSSANESWAPEARLSQDSVRSALGVSASKIMKNQTIAGISGTATSDGTAGAGDIFTGKTAYVNGSKVTGTMTNQGAKTASLDCGGSYTIPAGYHNGSGKVTANSLSSQTSATATASDIVNGKTAWVNGSKITGSYEKPTDYVFPYEYVVFSNKFDITGLSNVSGMYGPSHERFLDAHKGEYDWMMIPSNYASFTLNSSNNSSPSDYIKSLHTANSTYDNNIIFIGYAIYFDSEVRYVTSVSGNTYTYAGTSVNYLEIIFIPLANLGHKGTYLGSSITPSLQYLMAADSNTPRKFYIDIGYDNSYISSSGMPSTEFYIKFHSFAYVYIKTAEALNHYFDKQASHPHFNDSLYRNGSLFGGTNYVMKTK